MKKFSLKIAVACMFLTLGTTACNDMLEEVNYGNPTTEELMSDPAKVSLVVDQAYAELKFVHDHWGYWGVNLLTSDEGICPAREGGDWNDGGYWRNLNTHNWNKMADAFENVWKNTISGAVLCNQVIYNLKKYPSDQSASMIVEMEVLRSYYYYLLFDCFGRIPYEEEFYEDKTRTPEPLMEPFRVWAHLVACLERNADKLPKASTTTYGRVTQGMAYTLLARLYLNAPSFKTFTPGYATEFIDQLMNDPVSMGVLSQLATDVPTFVPISAEADFYTNCCRCCDKVISSGSYSLSNDFFSNFAINNESSPENIFVIVEDGRGNFDVRYNGSMMNKLRINMLTFHYAHQESWNMIEKPWNGFCARYSFLRKYGINSNAYKKYQEDKDQWGQFLRGYEIYVFNDDARGPGTEWNANPNKLERGDTIGGTGCRNRWGWFIGPVCAKGSKKPLIDSGEGVVITPEITSLSASKRTEGARLWKYEVDENARYRYCENDFVLFRLADVYWMNEEAMVRGAVGGQHHWDAIDVLMARAFPYSGTSDADHIAEFKKNYGDPKTWTVGPRGACDKASIAYIDERGREFAWENVRRRDLIRFGLFNKTKNSADYDGYIDFVENVSEYRQWFPIPFKVLETAVRDGNGNAIWTQNAGYN